jgi:hypothetical protein
MILWLLACHPGCAPCPPRPPVALAPMSPCSGGPAPSPLRSNELVASFRECPHRSPWPSWRPKTIAGCDAVRKRRGTPRQPGGWKAHEHCLCCSCIPEMYEPHIHALSPHISRGSADQQNSQPVILELLLMLRPHRLPWLLCPRLIRVAGPCCLVHIPPNYVVALLSRSAKAA